MANQVRDLIVRILADTTKLNTGVDQTNQKLGALGRTAKVVGGAFAAYAAADVAIDFLSEATTAATEDAKAQELLANTLKNTTEATDASVKSTEKWIEKTMFATGVADDQLRPALGVLATATGDIAEAQDLLSIALDISAARGLDLETVSLALAKAQDGQATSLQRLGINTKDASGATLEFDQIMANATQTFGGSAQTAADSTAGKMAILKVRFDELKEQIGTALIPVIEKLIDFLNDDLVPAIETVWPVVERVFNLVSSHIKNAINIIRIVLDPLMDLVRGDWGEAWESFRDRIKVVWDGIVNIIRTPVDLIIDIVEGMVDAVNEAVERIVEFFLSIPKKIAGLGGKILAEITGGAGGLVGKAIGLIPGLAEGGIVTKPTLALIGEAGPEAVVPLRGVRSASDFDRPLGGGGGGTVINMNGVTVVANSAEQLIASINDYARRNGGLRVPGGVTAVS